MTSGTERAARSWRAIYGERLRRQLLELGALELPAQGPWIAVFLDLACAYFALRAQRDQARELAADCDDARQQLLELAVFLGLRASVRSDDAIDVARDEVWLDRVFGMRE